MAEQKKKRKAGIKRGKVRNPDLPRTKIGDWGFSKIISEIEKAIDLFYRRK